MSAMAMARVRPVRSAAMRMMAGRGRPGIPYYERVRTGEERRHEDDGGEGEAMQEYLTMSAMGKARVRPVRSTAMRMMAGRGRPCRNTLL
jgi:hypothetical protein